MVLGVVWFERKPERRREVLFSIPRRALVPWVLTRRYSEPVNNLSHVGRDRGSSALTHSLNGRPKVNDYRDDVAAEVDPVTPLEFVAETHARIAPGLARKEHKSFIDLLLCQPQGVVEVRDRVWKVDARDNDVANQVREAIFAVLEDERVSAFREAFDPLPLNSHSGVG